MNTEINKKRKRSNSEGANVDCAYTRNVKLAQSNVLDQNGMINFSCGTKEIIHNVSFVLNSVDDCAYTCNCNVYAKHKYCIHLSKCATHMYRKFLQYGGKTIRNDSVIDEINKLIDGIDIEDAT